MAKGQVQVNITEVTISTGKTAYVEFLSDDKKIRVEIPAELNAFFKSQFLRANPTPAFKQRYVTLMNLMRAAYKQGLADAKK